MQNSGSERPKTVNGEATDNEDEQSVSTEMAGVDKTTPVCYKVLGFKHTKEIKDE